MPALENLAQAFVEACGGAASRIALLMVPNFQPHEEKCRQVLGSAGAGEIRTVVPPASLILEGKQLRMLEQSTGIFMAGGSASQYQRIYGTERVARLVRQMHAAGVPYGGLSAGSMMAAKLCDVGSTLVHTRTNEYLLAAEGHASPPGVDLRAGLGLIQDSVLQPHLTEWGQFPELLEDMRLGRCRVGLGLDNSICLELREGAQALVRGRGRLYVLRRRPMGSRGSTFEVETYEPGARFDLATRRGLRRSDRA